MHSRPDRPMRARSRASNACQRCRKHKIKCTGVAPCASCEIRGGQCIFNTPDDKITVSASAFRALKSKVHQLENQRRDGDHQNHSITASPPRHDMNASATAIAPSLITTAPYHVLNPRNSGENHTLNNHARSVLADAPPRATRLSNPMVPKRPVYISDQWGKLMYLGHSSTRSFSRQTLLMISQSPNSTSTIPLSSFVEGDINGETSVEQAVTLADISGLPSLELSLFYVQTVKFRTQPLYYLLEETDFVAKLRVFYEDVMTYAQSNRLWFIHYLLVMSLGRALSPQSQIQTGPYASLLFDRALRLLPDASVMCRDFVTSTEIHCCIAVFLQSLDHRCASHIHIGQALHMAQMQGLHTDMQAETVGVEQLERGRRLWWTVYTLHRRQLSTLGLPNTLQDKDVMSPIPNVSNGNSSSTAMAIHVRICQLLGRILNTVYSFDGTVNKTYLITAKEVLKGIGGLADDLAHFAARCPGEISRVVSHLSLAYHQCIILTTRPMIFHLLELRFNSADPSSSVTVLSSTKGLVQACVDSAVKVALIISKLQQYDLLDIFLPFDLESAFSAAMVLVMASGIHHKLLPEENHVDTLHAAFDYMIDRGSGGNNSNSPVHQRKAEIEELSQIIRQAEKRVRLVPPLQQQQQPPQSSASHDEYAEEGMDTDADADVNAEFAERYPSFVGGADGVQQNLQLRADNDDDDGVGAISPLPDVASLPSIGEPFFDEWIMTDGLSGAMIMDLADALHTDLFDTGEMDI